MAEIYIVDDDYSVAQTLALMAETIGLKASTFTETCAFFEAVAREQPAYIALDLQMPDMDGVEVLRRLAELRCDSRIIIASGLGARILKAAGLSAEEHGLDILGVLAKPFALKSLRSLLARDSPQSARSSRASRASADFSADDIQQALVRREFSLVYQPKVECKTERLRGFEVLLRWKHPQHGMIGPDFFIPVAEQAGLMGPITEFVIDEALAWRRKHEELLQRACPGLHFSINISAKNLRNIEFADTLASALAGQGVPASCIILELTETAAMEDPTTSLDLLTRLRMKGFSLSIDDFGTGYSSMAQLVRLPFSEIKIDKSFVGTSEVSEESKVAIRSIIELGRSLGMQSTAEGVESAAALQFLASAGCDLCQGYFISKPMPGDEVPAWIEQKSRPALSIAPIERSAWTTGSAIRTTRVTVLPRLPGAWGPDSLQLQE